jgi:spore germination protein GerM
MTKLVTFLAVILISAHGSFAQQMMTVTVYFHNEKLNPNQDDCRKVFPTVRTILKTKAVAKAALEELFEGTTEEEKAKQFWSFPAKDTKDILKNINVRNGTAYVNFSNAVYSQLGNVTSSCGGGLFSMVEQTLLQFPTIKKVFYAIEGNPADFYDWIQVSECPRELKSCSGKNFR